MSEPITVVAAGSGAASNGPRRGRTTPSRGKATTAPRKSKPAVADKELTEALSIGLSVVLMGYMQFVARAPREIRDELDPTTEECDAFCTPIARLLNRQAFGNTASAIAGGADWFVAAAAAMSYVDRVGPVLKQTRTVRSATPRTPKAATNGHVQQNPEAEVPTVTGRVGPYGLGPQQFVD